MDQSNLTGNSFDEIMQRFLQARKKVDVLDSEFDFRQDQSDYWSSLDLVIESLYVLAERIFDVFLSITDVLDRESAVESMVNHAYDRISRFDPDKGKGRAWNFFTTVMLCQLRQQYRSAKHYNRLKKAYLKQKKSVGVN